MSIPPSRTADTPKLLLMQVLHVPLARVSTVNSSSSGERVVGGSQIESRRAYVLPSVCQVAADGPVAISACPDVGAVAELTDTVVVAETSPRACTTVGFGYVLPRSPPAEPEGVRESESRESLPTQEVVDDVPKFVLTVAVGPVGLATEI